VYHDSAPLGNGFLNECSWILFIFRGPPFHLKIRLFLLLEWVDSAFIISHHSRGTCLLPGIANSSFVSSIFLGKLVKIETGWTWRNASESSFRGVLFEVKVFRFFVNLCIFSLLAQGTKLIFEYISTRQMRVVRFLFRRFPILACLRRKKETVYLIGISKGIDPEDS